MPWTTPITRAPNDLYTAAQWNTHIRDNLNFLHDTHGPLWIPVERFLTLVSPPGQAAGVTRGTSPDGIHVAEFGPSASLYLGASEKVPNDWISGGFAAYIWWAPADGTAGDVRWDVETLFLDITANEDAAAAGTLMAATAATALATNRAVRTLIGTTAAPTAGDLIRIAVRRDGLHADDDYAANAGFMGIELGYT